MKIRKRGRRGNVGEGEKEEKAKMRRRGKGG